jgi:hypothetical protein
MKAIETCADCGREVVFHRGRWANIVRPDKEWSYVCRLAYEDDDEHLPRLVSADYHYIEGEVQDHWPPNVDRFRLEAANHNPQEGEASNADKALEPSQRQ